MALAVEVCVNVNRVKLPYDCGRARRAFTARLTCQRRSDLPSAGMLTAPGSLVAPARAPFAYRPVEGRVEQHRMPAWDAFCKR